MKYKRIIMLSAGLIFFSALTPLSLAYANEKSGSSTETSETNPNAKSEKVKEKQAELEKAKKSEASQRAKERAEQLKKTEEVRKEEIKEKVEAKKVEIKKDICENRQERLTSLQPRVSNKASEIKTLLDQRYDKVVEFYTSKNLTVENYESLIQAIEVAKANSATAISALNGYKFEVDCTSETVADQLAAYREAASGAKASLKEYRSKLVDLITSIKATQNTSTSNEGGTSNAQ